MENSLDRGSEQDFLIPYWLRTVRVGLVVTGLTVVALLVMLFIPGHGPMRTDAILAILGAATVGGVGVALLPWRKLFDRGVGMRFLYAWSGADIVLVTFAVVASGGARSPLFAVYFLTTVFFGTSYPPRAQVALLGFTFLCYLGALAGLGWHVAAGVLFLRLASLAILTLLSSFLSRELLRQMEAQREARRSSERWASLLSTVASAARAMPLDRDLISGAALDTVLALGFDGASLCELDEEAGTYRILGGRGIPDDVIGRNFPSSMGVTGMVLSTGATVALEDYAASPQAIPTLRDQGFHAVVATPLWIRGWLAAVLVGGSLARRRLEPLEVQAFELLAGQTALALENAMRYEEEHDAVERLRELDAMKSDFLATVSHELRTPVTVIQGAGVTLERTWDTVDDETRRQLLAGLNSNAFALNRILNTLLDFSRVERGAVEIQKAPIDVADLLERTALRLGGLFDGRHLQTEIEPDLAAMGDVVLLGRTLDNLLSNAVKHTPPGSTVTLSGRREGTDVVVSVTDDGPGLPEAEVARLGERFFRGGDLNQRPRGLGLGLALVGEMLELHGSRLEIDSRVGRGSRFSFRLPALERGHTASTGEGDARERRGARVPAPARAGARRSATGP